MDQATLERLADLAVTVGANVQPGQIVCVHTDVERIPLARAVADRAYRAGARHVEVVYGDPWLQRSRIEHGADESIGFAPSWAVDRIREMGEQHVATIRLEGAFDPAALAGVNGERLGRDQPPTRQEMIKLVGNRLVNWSILPAPSAAWAELVHPDLEPAAALERLWEDIVFICRLDHPDPAAAWLDRMKRLREVADRLDERRFSAIAFSGDGTDLTVGLLPSSRWLAASFSRFDGLEHYPNLPSEEVFTAPDPERVDGYVRATKPLDLEGTLVEGLRVRFEGGHAVEIDADSGADVLRARCSLDEGASRLGELALVDGEGRIGQLDTVFYTTLIDENAASHLALGNAYSFSLRDEADRVRANASVIHIDFMIGSPELDVDGVEEDGTRVPLLRGGAWQI
jgi:aminopeptidase